MSYDYRHAYEAWYDNGLPKRKKPAGVERLGPAAPLEDRGDDENSPYPAFLFRHRGKAVLAIGCRRFSLDEAKAWWGGVASVDVVRDDLHDLRRKRRARYIVNSVVKRATNRAKKLGWKI